MDGERVSVICHTNDYTRQDLERKYSHGTESYANERKISASNEFQSGSYSSTSSQSSQRRENKDSGFEDDDVFDEEEGGEKCMSFSHQLLKIPLVQNSHRGNNLNLLQSQTASLSQPILHNEESDINPYSKAMSHDNDILTQMNIYNPDDIDFKRRFELSVLNALGDPKFRYWLSLYRFIDENLLKKTLLKFVKSSTLESNMLQEANRILNQTSSTNACDILNNLHSENISVRALRTQSVEMSEDEDVDVGSYDFPISEGLMSKSTATSNVHLPTLATLSSTEKTSTRQLSLDTDTRDENGCKKCEYCQKPFNTNLALDRHLRTHKGKRNHKCAYCSRSFYDQSSYSRHLRSHNGDKKHKCKECSMAFNKRSALEVHIRTHTGERPFVCDFCGKGFSISGNLHRHILIHTGHRPYKCGKCPRTFNNPSHLARHISSFHTN